jgi:hypothetical protein
MSAVPTVHWPELRRELNSLVGGDRPDLMTWVRDCRDTGATLIRQPELIWAHPRTDFLLRSGLLRVEVTPDVW